jgi:hypothetical protein
MTLAQLIAVYEARMPQPISSGAVLTPRGDAVVLLIRLHRQLDGLESDDRDYVLDLVRGLVADVGRTA